MRDDEKMFNIGWVMLMIMVFLTAILPVCYRVQNNNLESVRRAMENTKHEYDLAKTRFSALSSSDLLRGSVIGINPRAETVSFSKTVHINDIPMVKENAI